MIRINLLPEAYRKTSTATIQPLYRSPLAILIVVLLILGGAGLWGTFIIRQAQYQQLQAKQKRLESKYQELTELLGIVQKLQSEQTVLDRLVRGRSQWARSLNRLSDTTPDGVWFTDLSLDPMKGLIIQGSAVSQGGEEMVRIGRLVQDLKVDPDFSSAIRDVQIESIKSVQEKEIDVIEFTLTGKITPTASGNK